ncbi:MAG: hypothetical protein WBP64_17735 [Nitrososphaeraceae archaeon]
MLSLLVVVGIGLSIVTAASFVKSAMAASSGTTNGSNDRSSDNSKDGSSKNSSSSSSDPNALSKKDLKNFVTSVSTASKQSIGLNARIIRDCYDQAKGIGTSTSTTSRSTSAP